METLINHYIMIYNVYTHTFLEKCFSYSLNSKRDLVLCQDTLDTVWCGLLVKSPALSPNVVQRKCKNGFDSTVWAKEANVTCYNPTNGPTAKPRRTPLCFFGSQSMSQWTITPKAFDPPRSKKDHAGIKTTTTWPDGDRYGTVYKAKASAWCGRQDPNILPLKQIEELTPLTNVPFQFAWQCWPLVEYGQFLLLRTVI